MQSLFFMYWTNVTFKYYCCFFFVSWSKNESNAYFPTKIWKYEAEYVFEFLQSLMRKKAQKNNKLQEIIQLDFVSVPYVFEFLFPVK